MSIQSSTFMIVGEGLLLNGLAYQNIGDKLMILGMYGLSSHGFIWNRNEIWGPLGPAVSTGWTGSFTPAPTTTWTNTFGTPSTTWVPS
jgi:hypothetical protein